MGQEIERKFLVKGDFKRFATRQLRIKQGYLSSVSERTVRVRIKGDKGYLTIKGEAGDSGISRYEWEKEIPVTEAEELLALCEPGLIDKTRYLVPAGEFTFEVDEFYGENEGLIIAEIELKSESDQFPKPEWLGEEVTGDLRYYNSVLIKNPFTRW
jgi:adenylate cyclase